MNAEGILLASVYDGWSGYNQSLIHAIEPLTPEQLAWRTAEGFRSVGELARHISLGRIEWFMRMNAPGSDELIAQIADWEQDRDGIRHIVEESIAITEQAGELARWLGASWQMVDATLKQWTVSDLATTYRHTYNGTAYAVSRQWTIWRIMAHDIHHGGQLSLMLGQQGIEAFELIGLGGHITAPPLADTLNTVQGTQDP
jgi:uncharacterized damage-inducible protein DinB